MYKPRLIIHFLVIYYIYTFFFQNFIFISLIIKKFFIIPAVKSTQNTINIHI